jgi:hypothetical protein
LAISVMVGIVATALPAYAAPVGTAHLTTGRTVRSGAADQLFTFNVNNTGSTNILLPGTGINHVVVVPPGGFSTDLGSTTLAGWTVTRSSNGQIVFDAGTAPRLAPGSNTNFVVQADAATPPNDLSRTWKVFASDNGGQNLTQLSAPANQSLETALKTLEVLSVQITGPSGVTDHTATEEQGGIQVQTRITNMGSATQNVTPTLSGRSVTIESAPGPRDILPGATEAFDFVVKLGTKAQYTCTNCGGGRVALTGGGTAPSSNAITAASQQITVLSKVVGAFQTGTLAPRDLAINKSYAFALSIEKDGEAALANLTGTTFTFANGAFSAPVASPPNIAAGENQSVRLEFASTLLSGVADGSYNDGKLLLRGTDENGMTVSQDINAGDTLNVDSLVPLVTATISGPAPRVAGAAPATTDGATLNLQAVVTDGAANAPCNTCEISEAHLQQYAGGTPLGTIPVTLAAVTSSNPLAPAPGGTFRGTYTGAYDPAATSVELFVRAEDRADNGSTDISDLLDVDNIDPFVVGAETGANGTKNQILAGLSEPVTTNSARMAPTDWNVQGHSVQSAELQAGGTSVLLTVSPAVPDNNTPTVQYAPAELNRAFDRVAQNMVNQAVTAIDGIVPAAPFLAAVTGGESDGTRFHTNDSTPELIFGTNDQPVGAGHRIEVYNDLNDNGAIDGTEPRIGLAEASGNSVAVTLDSLGTTDSDVNLLSRVLDARNNSSDLSDQGLKLDFTEPVVATVVRAASDVTVTFTEGLSARGRNFATDWTLHDRSISDPNFFVQFKPTSVSGSGISRNLSVTDGDWATATLTHLEYEYLGPAGARHSDLAGNELVNFMRAV